MIGKMFLPWVGGSSAAWNTCMFFFQALLLAGYSYTHLSISRLGVKRQSYLQLPLMLLALFFLPFVYSNSAAIPDDPSTWLLVQLFKTIGLPFFIVSGIAPLLQVWFANTMHKRATNPFFLYAASNTGSLGALLVYPTLIEPSFDLAGQAQLWTAGYVLLMVLMAVCFSAVKKTELSDQPVEVASADSPTPTTRTIAFWVAAAFVPSSMLLAVTQYLTTDLVPVPMFWIIPLMIYLTTYIFAFSEKLAPRAASFSKLSLLVILSFMSFYLFVEITYFWFSLLIHLFTLFSVAMFCHTAIAESKPAVKHLTTFYLWISFGGVLGGFFNSLLAPVLFSDYFEYPILIVLSCLLIDRFNRNQPQQESELQPKTPLPAAVSAVTGLYIFAAIIFISNLNLPEQIFHLATYFGYNNTAPGLKELLEFIGSNHGAIRQAAFALAAIIPAFILMKRYRVAFAPVVAVVLILIFVYNIGQHKIIRRYRNFFGVKKIFFDTENNLRYLAHGSTVHGKQSFVEGWRNEPLTYYHRRGPLGDIFSLPAFARNDLKVGIIGLGIGSMAAYSKPGNEFVFYELDPQVVDIAQKTGIFSYLKEFASNCKIQIGDGRLKIMQAAEQYFDIIVIDAFSSDAVPIHLLTVEAMKIYLSKLKDGGIIVVHVSNRYLNLQPNLQALARSYNLQQTFIADSNFDPNDSVNYERSPAEFAIFAKDAGIVNYLANISDNAWAPIDAYPNFKAWTDSHSSIFPLLNFRTKTQIARTELQN
ncbi:MAG: fused MFS/spermidine synthase [Candidatus Riflebacteria bacterium]|nr:fused MFS/spermidine synthase [Candidatus Riflebacteria bacterium]